MKRDELLKGLTPEQVEKARKCHDSKELLELAKNEGIQLNDEQLEAVSGGACDFEAKGVVCPICKSPKVRFTHNPHANNSEGETIYTCEKCHFSWKE